MTKYIHIHAKCNSFELFEQVTEKQAVERLRDIKENFNQLKNRADRIYDKLVVKTKLVNPEFNF